MKRTFRKLSSLLLATVMVFSLSMTAFAADSTVTYTGKGDYIEFAPGSVYTDTDLFDNFKDIMPGDVRSEEVTLQNRSKNSDYIKVWMRAVLHDENDNTISPKVLNELQKDDRRGNLSKLEYMNDFLDRLTLTIWKGDKKDANIIYKGSPDSLEKGFEDGNVYLGSFKYNESIKLNMELAVDIEMGNEYADRIGEVDWVFVIEERDNPSNPDTPDETDEPEVYPYIPEATTPTKTGDSANVVLWIILLVAALVMGVYFGRKNMKRRHSK